MADATTVELDAQYRQLREECGLLDRSNRGKLVVSGPDAADYLQGQLTNDVEALGPGDGQYAALLDRKGHIQADMRVLRLAEEELWVDIEPVALATARRHLDMYKIGRQLDLADQTAERAIFSLIGPRSAALAGTPALPRHACADASVGGVDCLAVGTRMGIDRAEREAGAELEGIDLIAATADAERLREGLLGAGAVAVRPEAVEILRIEAGALRFGADMSEETMPAEAGIVEAAVNFEKGCYIGQEPVARLHYRGRPNRHLRGLRLSGPAEAGAPLWLGEKQVGAVGSFCVSPAFGPIALAIVRREAEPGSELAVGEDGVTARVNDLPFG